MSGAGTLVGARWVLALFGWLGTVIIVRELSAEAWGALSFVLSLLGLIGFLADLRLSRIVIASVVDADDRVTERVVSSYVTLRLLIGVVSYAVAVGFVAIGGYPRSVMIATAIAGFALVAGSVASGYFLLYEARLWLSTIARSDISSQIVQFALIGIIALAGVGGTVTFAIPELVNALVALAILAWSARSVVRPRLRVDRSLWWEWLKESIPLAIGATLGTIYFRIDIVMLSLMDSLTSVGLYSIGYKFADFLESVPNALLTPALTLFVASWPRDVHGVFHRTFRQVLVVLVVAGIGVAVGFAVFAGSIIPFLYGDRYDAAVGASRYLVVGAVLHFFTLLAFTTLVAVRRNLLYPVATLSGVVINVVLNLILIPSESFDGAAYATVATEGVVLLVLAVGVLRLDGVHPLPWGPIAKAFLAGTAFLVAGVMLLAVVHWLVAAVASSLLFLGVLHIVKIDGPGGLGALLRDSRIAVETDPPNGTES